MIFHPELPVVAFLSAFLVLVPLPWHWRAGTVATVAISLWLFLANLINGINSIVWSDNVLIVAPVWCDIATKIMMGSNVALPAAVFCLCIHLERVSSIRQVRTTHNEKRRRQWFDALLCFGIPLIYMALHYVVQGHRFDIVENFGCRPTIYVSLASTFIIWVPPLFFSVGSCILAASAFRNFWMRRITFSKHLQASNSALTISRYFRLMCMAVVQMFFGIAVTAVNMWFTMRHGLLPWISWENVHVGFSRIAVFPTVLIPAQQWICTYLLWWTIPVSSLLFFAFFSFGEDAMKEYRACISWLKTYVLRRSKTSSYEKHIASLPSFCRRGPRDTTLPTQIEVDVSIAKAEEAYKSPSSSASSFNDATPPSASRHYIPRHLSQPAPLYYDLPSSIGSTHSLRTSPEVKGFRVL